MQKRRTIDSVALALSERIPFFGQLPSNTRKGILLGSMSGVVLFFLAGALLGQLNRGWSGAVVGGLSSLPAGLISGAIVGGFWGRRHLPQEGQASIQIRLDNGSALYAPGEAVSGSVEITTQNTLRLGRGQVFLVCRGLFVHDVWPDTDDGGPEHTVDSKNYVLRQVEFMRGTNMRRGACLSYRFSFPLPENALPSHDGHVCSVEWGVHVALDVPDVGPLRSEKIVQVQSSAPVLSTHPEGYQTVASNQSCQLALRLTRAVYTEGETMTGRVIMSTKEQVRLDSLRVLLLRIENVAKGDDQVVYVLGWDPEKDVFKGRRQPGGHGTTYVWLEDERVLASDLELEAPESGTYSFSFTVSEARRPTFATSEGSVMWKVGVIGERTELGDLRAFHEVVITTGAPLLGDIVEPSPS